MIERPALRYDAGMPDADHVPVLPQQVLEVLNPQPGQTFLDCTTGRGGHGLLLIPRLVPGGRYIGLDMDPANVQYLRQRFGQVPMACDFIHANFTNAGTVLEGLGVKGVDGLLADLGFASTQMGDPHRGLSFSQDGPLDMRLDPTAPTTAANLVNEMDERELADVIYRYGEERYSRRIAAKIVAERRKTPIRTTRQLASVCASAYGGAGGRGRIDPATRTFQALRIAVNGELESLEALVDALPRLLKPGARVAIISFHSLEDRIVKRAFAEYVSRGVAEKLTKKPLQADEQEVAVNRRSRSAKLRGLMWKGVSSS